MFVFCTFFCSSFLHYYKKDEQNVDNHMFQLRGYIHHANPQRQVPVQTSILQLLLVRNSPIIIDIPPLKINQYHCHRPTHQILLQLQILTLYRPIFHHHVHHQYPLLLLHYCYAVVVICLV